MQSIEAPSLKRSCNPFLPPWWRWIRAGKIASGTAVNTGEIDATVRSAARLRADLEKPDCGFPRMESHPPALVQAYQVFQEDGPRRWELEARLVAGQSDAEIGEKCGLGAEVVAVYEELFCSIRHRRAARGYLLKHLIGPGVQVGFEDHEVGRFWTWMAMGGGPLALDAFIDAFHAARCPGQPAGLTVYLQPDARIDPDIQVTVAAAVLPSHGPAAAVFRQIQLTLSEARAAQDPDRAAFLRERARRHAIKCGRAHLDGKPLPRLPRLRPATAGKGDGLPNTPPMKEPRSFAMLDDLVAAACSGSRAANGRKP